MEPESIQKAPKNLSKTKSEKVGSSGAESGSYGHPKETLEPTNGLPGGAIGLPFSCRGPPWTTACRQKCTTRTPIDSRRALRDRTGAPIDLKNDFSNKKRIPSGEQNGGKIQS